MSKDRPEEQPVSDPSIMETLRQAFEGEGAGESADADQ
jgi:hypothetical protein